MAIEPGDVVTLKSGGQPMTVAAVEENSVECLWIGDDGELFRESIPGIALRVVAIEEDDDLDVEDEDDEDEEHDDAEDEEHDDEGKSSKKKRRSA